MMLQFFVISFYNEIYISNLDKILAKNYLFLNDGVRIQIRWKR